jgi:type I restriction enzyme S subunit
MDGSLVGRNFAKVNSDFLPLLLVQRVARIRSSSTELNQDYLYQFFTSEYFIKYVDSVKTSSGIPHISSKQINDFEIPILPIVEQKHIAKVLGDFDLCIENIGRLILQKNNRKKALLKKLVLGKVRFKEFSDEWEEMEIGELLEYEQPTKYLSEPNDDLKNGIPVLTANKSFILGHTNDTVGIYTNLPVVIFDDFTTDTKFVTFPFKVKSSAIKMLQPKSKNINLKFVFERMSLIQTNISDHKRRFISEYQYNTIGIPSIKEQNKISAVLFDADEEIQKLKQQHEKLKLQKKGLMQQLLTGKLRVKTK